LASPEYILETDERSELEVFLSGETAVVSSRPIGWNPGWNPSRGMTPAAALSKTIRDAAVSARPTANRYAVLLCRLS
jgi:hypothetical protein